MYKYGEFINKTENTPEELEFKESLIGLSENKQVNKYLHFIFRLLPDAVRTFDAH